MDEKQLFLHPWEEKKMYSGERRRTETLSCLKKQILGESAR